MDTHSLYWWCNHCGLRKCNCISVKVRLSFHAWNSSKNRVFYINFKKIVPVTLWCSPFSSTLIACHPFSIIGGIFFCEFLHFYLYTLNTFRSFYSRIFFYAFWNFGNVCDFLLWCLIISLLWELVSLFFPQTLPLMMYFFMKIGRSLQYFSRKVLFLYTIPFK